AFIGARLEFATLQRDSAFPTKAYATWQVGAVMLDGHVNQPIADGAADLHRAYRSDHVGAGLLAPSGPYHGSYLQVGWGRSDLFVDPSGTPTWTRLKIDANLSFPMGLPFTKKIWGDGPRVFIQMFGDFDPRHKSSDAIQTFVGLDFDVRSVFKW